MQRELAQGLELGNRLVGCVEQASPYPCGKAPGRVTAACPVAGAKTSNCSRLSVGSLTRRWPSHHPSAKMQRWAVGSWVACSFQVKGHK